jgi:ABC-type sugar transport system ATPase subunit
VTVALQGVKKSYDGGAVSALGGIDLDVGRGELLVVVGPSGSGKTTLLRCVAGLEELDEGRVHVDGRDVTRSLPGDRDVAMVFQELALYPHISVRDNISFGLRARRATREEIDERIERVARMLEIEEILNRRPNDLAGGEKQRVALARAIVREPAAFLMDEPLSNLDAELRLHARADIRALQRELDTTTIYVTHDQVEAMTMGDRVAVLRAGRVEQVDRPTLLYDRPATTFVAGFLGSPPMNLFPADLLDSGDGSATLGARPEKIRLVGADDAPLSGPVRAVEPIGGESIVHVEVGDRRFFVRVERESAPSEGEYVGLDISPRDIYRFDDSGRALG